MTASRGGVKRNHVRGLSIVCFVLFVAGCRGTGEEDLRKGNVFFANQDYERAQKHYEAALVTAPSSVRAMEALGNVAYERGDSDVAIDWYKKAIDTNDNAISARHKLAVVLSGTKRIDEAIHVLEETVKIATDDAFAFHALGGLARKKGDLAKAEKMQVQALTVDENYHAARFALVMIMIDAGRTEEAERQLTRLVRSGQASMAEYGYARIAAKANKPAAAAKHLERVLESNVTRPEKILEDAAFADSWTDPAMKALRTRLASTSTTTK